MIIFKKAVLDPVLEKKNLTFWRKKLVRIVYVSEICVILEWSVKKVRSYVLNTYLFEPSVF